MERESYDRLITLKVKPVGSLVEGWQSLKSKQNILSGWTTI